MRRLIALVIIGLGIAIAIHHLRKKENRSIRKDSNVRAPGIRKLWIDDSRVIVILIPALLIKFNDE